MRGILPVLLIFSTISIGSVLSFGSYFSDPYAKNIDTVVNLTRQICRDEEDDSAFPEGDVNETDEKLPEIRQQFHKMRKHFNAIKGKRDLRDRINDLRTENTVLQNALDKRSFPLTDEVKNNYSKYLGLHRILEKAVLDYLAMDKKDGEKRNQLVDEQMNPNEVMLELEKLFSENETANFAKTMLKWNEYSDETFNLLYRLTKNHAILISVAASFRKMILIPFALENPDVFRAVLHDVRIQYQHYLNVIVETNQWREKNGFHFTHLYKYYDRDQIAKDISMPHSTIQNNFLWNNETETFNPKYFYLSIKIPVHSQLRFRNCDWVAEDTPDIKYFVIRSQTHEKELVFYDQQTIADKFQKVVREKLKGIDSHNMVADELADNTGLIVLATTNNYMKYDDDLYTARGAYKLTLRTFFNQTKEECQKKRILSTNECEEKHKTQEVITVPYVVIGYFLYGNQGTDVVKRQ